MDEKIQNRIIELKNSGKNQNEIVATLYLETSGKHSLNEILGQIREVAKMQGWAPTLTDRKNAVTEKLEAAEDPTSISFRNSVAETLSIQFFVPEQTIHNDINTWLKNNGFELSRGHKYETMKKVILDLESKELSRKEIAKSIMESHGYSEATANSLVSKVFVEAGIARARNNVDHFATMAAFTEFQEDKERAIQKMVEHGHVSESTAKSMFSMKPYFEAYYKLKQRRLSANEKAVLNKVARDTSVKAA